MLYIIIGCILIIGFLLYKLNQKQTIDKQELEKYNKQLIDTKAEKRLLDDELNYEKYKLDECKKDLQVALVTYQDLVDNKMTSIDAQLEDLRVKRTNELEALHKSETERLNKEFAEYSRQLDERKTIIHDAAVEAQQKALEWTKIYQDEANKAQKLYQSLLEPIKQYQKERQARLFYTIQLPEEYQEDIEFLLVTVAAKVQHPDIISKLVWAEYVKPNLDNTFKRIEIKPEPGIYKLTSLETGMSYVGKSTDVKKRIADHFKSSIGIKSIADQAVHHAILKEGFWNWAIEVITYCDKDELSELEKYYIDFFKTQEFGYNKNAGG